MSARLKLVERAEVPRARRRWSRVLRPICIMYPRCPVCEKALRVPSPTVAEFETARLVLSFYACPSCAHARAEIDARVREIIAAWPGLASRFGVGAKGNAE